MNRHVLIALCCFALAPASVLAQRVKPVEIEEASFGLPPGRFIGEKDVVTQKSQPVTKPNTWAPLYLKLKVNREVKGGIAAVITAIDADGQRTTNTVPLINNISDRLPGSKIEPSEIGSMPYVRSANRFGNTTITITIVSTAKGYEGSQLSDEFRITNPGFRESSTFVVLSLGSRLPGFDLPKGSEKLDQGSSSRGALRNGRVETAAITNVSEMPDQWVGYQGADLVVLTTGSAPNDFLDQLFDPEKSRPYAARRNALLEHVRQGGNLVISVGGNALKLANSPIFRDLLPVKLSPDKAIEAVPELLLSWAVAGTNVPVTSLRSRNATFSVANTSVTPQKPARVLLEPRENDKLKDLPVVAQGSYGLGRITVVTFDLDQSPFTEFSKRAEFWDYLIRNATSERAALPPGNKVTNFNPWGSTGSVDTEDDFLVSLRAHVDFFEGVPVISFGWVALFILLYTLLIGPVEYLFLKFVLRRLELTWITFPLIVLSVSAAAYFTAYALKGSDLRLNKIDLLDVDLGSNRVYGRSWFTVFSPRVDKYTVFVEPREEWVNTAKEEGPPLMDWMAGSQTQGGSGGLLGRSYDYQLGKDGEMAAGLREVRIPVWSTKAMTAQWTGTTPTDTPLIQSSLIHPPGNPEAVSGSFTYNLPTPPVSNAVLFYRGVAYKLPTLTYGQKVTIPAIGADRGGLRSTLETDTDWFSREAYLVNNPNNSNPNPWAKKNQPNVSPNVSLFGALFHQKALGGDGRDLQNASVRSLDQSWRIASTNKDEVILVGRTTKSNGPTEQMMNGTEAPSPVKLWLKDIPGQDANGKPKARPIVPGSLQQETYFRVYIPIQPVKTTKDKN
jgi:hypothetical protein